MAPPTIFSHFTTTYPTVLSQPQLPEVLHNQDLHPIGRKVPLTASSLAKVKGSMDSPLGMGGRGRQGKQNLTPPKVGGGRRGLYVAPENEPYSPSQVKLDKPRQRLSPSQAQEIICRFFLALVKQHPPEVVLQKFKHLFIEPTVSVNSITRQALEQIALQGQEETFINTLKRSIYILVNNWSASRQQQYIQELVELLSVGLNSQETFSVTLKHLHLWRGNFVNSQDYQELKIFVSKYDKREKRHWSERYSSYLLVSQSVDARKLVEQREAARTRYEQLKEQFKLELAMYTARTPLAASQENASLNPTTLGEEALHLIEKTLLKHEPFSYASCARIFLKQTQQLCYEDLKKSLLNYLLFAFDDQDLAEVIKTHLASHLEFLYETHHEETWNSNLLLRTCNRVIEYLTILNLGKPSALFISLATQGKAFSLVVVMLRIVLLCPPTSTHLECCLAQLIQHYESESESECQWLIRFLEVLQVTLTIYAENVRYNLVNMAEDKPENPRKHEGNPYRIFSQLKRKPKKQKPRLNEYPLVRDGNSS